MNPISISFSDDDLAAISRAVRDGNARKTGGIVTRSSVVRTAVRAFLQPVATPEQSSLSIRTRTRIANQEA